MHTLQIALFVAPPVIAVAYGLLEHFGLMDRWTGRGDALKGLKRMQSAAGYPVCFLYDDQADSQLHKAVWRRISRRVTGLPRDASNALLCPSCICTAGQPVVLVGLQDDWPQEQRFIYTSQHPVVLMYGITRAGGTGKLQRACSLGELEKWLSEEKESRKHWVGGAAIGLVSVGLIVLRLSVSS
jgi:hypothetical protein